MSNNSNLSQTDSPHQSNDDAEYLEGSIADYADGIRNGQPIKYSLLATKEQFDELFNAHNCVVVQYPKDMKIHDFITFYRNDIPERIMYTYPIDFYRNPNKLYRKNYNYAKKHNLFIPKTRADDLRIERERQLRESMKTEGCELISPYESSLKPVHYLFEGMDYKISPYRWYRGVRAHNVKCIRYTNEHIKQLFAKEGCELISPYVNQKSKLTYRYNGKEYTVVWNDWKFFNSRPHLGAKKTYFTEEA